ncbi:MAG: SUMF1/EgtB/PvdO family nonheme iron enzyme [Pseudorhodobacter sp.]
MQLSALSLAAATAGLIGIAIFPLSREGERPDHPDLILLTPEPFEHRVDGDWQRDGRPVDAPMATVIIPAPVEIMATPVSIKQWTECVEARACALPDSALDDPDLPVTGVSWIDATAYADWLSDRTGEQWRLPSDVEWAHAAGELFRDDAIGAWDDPANPSTRWIAEYAAQSARERDLDRDIRPVGSLNVTARGVRDIGGAVWEWTSTCLRRVETDAGGTILRENETCGIYIAEGLHRAAIIDFVRDPKSGGCSVGVPPANLGFRLIRETG